jgi:hypothetical protein
MFGEVESALLSLPDPQYALDLRCLICLCWQICWLWNCQLELGSGLRVSHFLECDSNWYATIFAIEK